MTCRHCGKNMNETPDVPRKVDPAADTRVPGGAPGQQPVIAAPPTAPAGDTVGDTAGDTLNPPVSIAFTPPGGATPMQPQSVLPAAVPPAAAPRVAPVAPASGGQDWGSAAPASTGADPYWQVKRATPASASGSASPETAGGKKADPKTIVSAILLLLGGVAAVAASLQPWITSSGNCLKEVVNESRRGFAGWEGKATAVLGAVCVILALVSFVRKDAGSVKAGLAAGIGIVAVGVYTSLTATSQVLSSQVSAREVVGMREDAARGLVTGCLDSGSLKALPEMWVYAVIAAGAVVVVGGLLALSVRSSPSSGVTTLSPPAK